MVLYAIMVITVALFKYHSTKDDNKVLDRIFRRIIGLVVVAFAPIVVSWGWEEPSGDPVIQGLVALIAAAITAIISQKPLALDPKYLVKAKKAPPLPRESWIRIGALCNFVLASLFAFSIILYHL